jgi:hypothetical protein
MAVIRRITTTNYTNIPKKPLSADIITVIKHRIMLLHCIDGYLQVLCYLLFGHLCIGVADSISIHPEGDLYHLWFEKIRYSQFELPAH